jgi:hypothetical protein
LVKEIQSNGVVETTHSDNVPLEINQMGVWCGVGGVVKLPFSFNGLFELRYEAAEGILREHMQSNIKTFQVILGIRTK